MTDARLRLFWHRAGPMTVALGTLAVAAAQGCGGGTSTNTGGTGGTSTTTTTGSMTTTTTSSTGGMGGMTTTTTTGTGGTTSDMLTAATLAGKQVSPFDATPDATGTNLYFTGLSNTAGNPPLAGVYTVSASGMAAAPTAVLAGAPYVAPFGIATSTDGKTLYVADPGADITLDANGNQIKGGSDLGEIFVQSETANTMPTVLMGSAGYDPRNLEVNSEGTPAADVVYFTGVDSTNGKPGVFKLAAAGATTPTTVAEGAPFVDPSGIAIGSDGTIYVADTLTATGGQIIAIPKGTTTPGTATTFVGSVRIGYPAGVALSTDGKTLLVSSLDPLKATDIILEFTVATPTMAPGMFNMTISAGTEAAGLHRAKAAEVFAFADGTVGAVAATGSTAAVPGGGVYTVK